MKSGQLVIVGDGEFATIAYEYFTHDSRYSVQAFAVESAFYTRDQHCGLPVVKVEDLSRLYPAAEYDVYVAITNPQLNRVRTRLYQTVKAQGYRCATYVSSHAFVWRNAVIGENTFVFESNVIQPFAEIGNNCVLWSGNHIGHRTVVKDNCFIASHAVISGYCEIGENSFLGVNCTVADNIKIARDNFIAMGAVIAKNTEENRIYRGNPAEAEKIPATRFCKVRGA